MVVALVIFSAAVRVVLTVQRMVVELVIPLAVGMVAMKDLPVAAQKVAGMEGAKVAG